LSPVNTTKNGKGKDQRMMGKQEDKRKGEEKVEKRTQGSPENPGES
jgi:hypothetical protein